MRRGAAAARTGARARTPRRALAVAVAVALAACATGRRRAEPPEPALRIWTPGVVHWSGERRDVRLAIENGTERTVRVEAPDARRARVVLYAGSGPDRVCGHDPDRGGDPDYGVALGPGESREVRIDLALACGDLPPGDYRYEIGYEAPAIGPGPNVRLRTVHGHVVVDPDAASRRRGSLGSGAAGDDAGERPAAGRGR